ncbi:MAG: 16S rRNA (uracil(1498)-N(3))-methyltransferase [Cyclobacteriaceae bacterium]|nr:16S rRNA (uracil(1498)-N(3))-methyltransferase [Cyclobacteriaceae bacterium]
MHLFYQPDITLGHLLAEESKHAIRVLRLEQGTEIELTDGKGGFYLGKITTADPHECGFSIIKISIIPPRNFSIHLAIAPTKNADRIEWMVEKAVEIGIEKISFIQCRTSERKSINIERLEKLVISAMKQSQKAWLPMLSYMIPFEKFVADAKESQRFIAYVDHENPDQLKNLAMSGSDYLITIGPEGDFTKEELSLAIASGFKKVSLGPSRLRTETAGLAALMTLNLLNQ